MIDLKTIESITQQVSQALPPSLGDVKDDVERNLHRLLQQQLVKLDLVSREEFDTQKAVLERTREKLQALEERLAKISQ